MHQGIVGAQKYFPDVSFSINRFCGFNGFLENLLNYQITSVWYECGFFK